MSDANSSKRGKITPKNRSEVSDRNIFSIPSTRSSQLPIDKSDTAISALHQEHLVQELIDNIFDEQRGIYEASSSYCSSARRPSSEYSFDNRLLYWKNVIQDRKLLAKDISNKTGKPLGDMLFNRGVTVDDRDKKTVKRVLDYAERMEPLRLINLQPERLNVLAPCEPCDLKSELFVQLPKPERDGETIVEITGMPRVTQEEQLGKLKESEARRAKWLNSKALEKHVCAKKEEIERVLEFYPDIEHLQVVGESYTKYFGIKRDLDIQVAEEHVKVISSETQLSEDGDVDEKVSSEETEYIKFGVRINDEVFKYTEKRSSKHVELEVNFVCEPFEYVTKRVLRIENIGQKVLSFGFQQRPYYQNTPQLLKSNDREFCFNHKPFRLIGGEFHDVIVQYQPRKVGVVKEKWTLKIDMQIFCRKTDTITLMLSGKCKPSNEYVQAIEHILTSVLHKSNLAMMRTLTTGLSSLTPLIQPDEVICPYQRALNERELFEIYNTGYKCVRYHDLELLKDIFQRARRPRDHAWDLKLESLKAVILRLEPAEKRALFFSELLGVLEDMKTCPIEQEDELLCLPSNPERDRARLVFVRGIICTGIDEWEDIAHSVEEPFLNSMIQEYLDMLAREEAEEETDADLPKYAKLLTESSTLLDDENLRQQLCLEVRRRKVFRDTLYVQTYSHLCDVIENIVSIIESTDMI